MYAFLINSEVKPDLGSAHRVLLYYATPVYLAAAISSRNLTRLCHELESSINSP